MASSEQLGPAPVVLITGGSRGIGAGTAKAFLEAVSPCTAVYDAPESAIASTPLGQLTRWIVVTCGLPLHTPDAEAFAATLPPHQRARFFHTAVDFSAPSVEADVAALVAFAASKGPLLCVVNNAGGHPDFKDLPDTTTAEWEELLRLNLLSAVTVSRAATPHLQAAAKLAAGTLAGPLATQDGAARSDGGSLAPTSAASLAVATAPPLPAPHLPPWSPSFINMSSWVGGVGQGGGSIYTATKGALTALTKSQALEGAAYGVRANSISPGVIWTPLYAEHIGLPGATTLAEAVVLPQGGPGDKVRQTTTKQPLGRFGHVTEVGAVAVHLSTASFTTGLDYWITGGAELGSGPKV